MASVSVSVSAGQTSQPVYISPGSSITLSPGAASSGIIEYSTDIASNVLNGVAAWLPWTFGPVSTAFGAKSDNVLSAVFVRVSASAGTMTLTINDPVPEANLFNALFSSQVPLSRQAIIPTTLSAGQNTAVILGDSITARCSLSSSTVAANVIGNGSVATITATGLSVLDGRVNFSQSGSSLDGQILQATNIDANTFSVPSSLVGSPPSPLVFSVQNQLSEKGWFTWLNAIAGQRFTLLNNAGIGGETVSMMASRLNRDVISYKPSFCFVMGGINDCNAGTAAATTFDRLKNIYTALIANGIQPIALTVTPLFTGHVNFAVSMPLIQQLNQLIKNYCMTAGIPCIDAHAAIVDPASATGSALTNALEADNIHPACLGARLIGAAGAAVLGTVPATPPGLTASQVDNFGANANNWQLIDTAPWSSAGTINPANVTGTVATGFTLQRSSGTGLVTGAAVNQRVAATDGDAIGFNQTFIMTSAGAGETWQLFPATIRTRLVVGATYQFRLPLRLTNTSGANLRGIQFQMAFGGAGGQSAQVRAWGNDATVNIANNYSDGTIYLYSPVFTVPSWFTSATGGFPILQFTFGAAGTALTVNCGRWTMQRMS